MGEQSVTTCKNIAKQQLGDSEQHNTTIHNHSKRETNVLRQWKVDDGTLRNRMFVRINNGCLESQWSRCWMVDHGLMRYFSDGGRVQYHFQKLTTTL